MEAHGIAIAFFKDAERHRCQNKIREAETDSAQDYMNQPTSPVMQGSNRREEKKTKKAAKGTELYVNTFTFSVALPTCHTQKWDLS